MGEWAALDTQKILLFCRDDNMFVLEDHFLSKDYYYDCTNQTCDLLNFAINKLQINRFFGILFICNNILAY